MKTKRVLLILLLFIILSSTVSCSTTQKNKQISQATQTMDNEKTMQTKDNENTTLSIYYRNEDYYVERALGLFRSKYPEIKIDAKPVPDAVIKDNMPKMLTELMAGEGPDIILFQTDFFNSLRKAVSSGVFCDLNEFLNKDKDFDQNAYYKQVFDCGVFDGKRYFIPQGFGISMFITLDSVLKKNGVNLDESNLTWESLGECAIKFMNNKNKSTKYLFNLSFNEILLNCNISFVNYETGESDFDKKEFKELLKIYKNIYPAIMPVSAYKELSYGDMISSTLDNFTAMPSTSGNLGDLYDFSSQYKEFLGEDIKVIPLPGYYKSNNVPAQIVYRRMIAMSSKCKNKDAGYDLIKLLLSKDGQTNINGDNWFSPVNKDAYKENVKYFTRSDVKIERYLYKMNSQKNMTYVTNPLPEYLVSQMDRMLENIKEPAIYDKFIFDTVNECIKDYLDGKKTEDQVAKEIDNKVNIFLNE